MGTDWNPVGQRLGMEYFSDMLRQLRRRLLESLEAREDRVHRDMAGLTNAMQRLDMPPPQALTAACSIATVIDATTTRIVLFAYIVGLKETFGEEVALGERDPVSLQHLGEAVPQRRLHKRCSWGDIQRGARCVYCLGSDGRTRWRLSALKRCSVRSLGRRRVSSRIEFGV